MAHILKKIIVTGGSGFIGSHFIEALISRYPETQIINLDLCTYAVSKNTHKLISNIKNVRHIKGSICDQTLIHDLYNEFLPDLIVNFAAESHVDNSIDDPKVFLETNIFGTYNLIHNLVSQENLKGTIFHHISTDEVYGDTGFSDDTQFQETSPIKPSSPYAASKASSEHLIRSWSRTYGLNYIITNCGNNFGPRQHNEKFIPTIIRRLSQNQKIPVYGDGKNVRDWIFVEDHANFLIDLYEKDILNETVNIGLNNELTNLEIIQSILEIHTKKKNFNQNDYVNFVDDRLGHDERYAIDNNKLAKILGKLKPANFLSNLEKTVEWFEKNPKW